MHFTFRILPVLKIIKFSVCALMQDFVLPGIAGALESVPQARAPALTSQRTACRGPSTRPYSHMAQLRVFAHSMSVPTVLASLPRHQTMRER
jgi:hypothetical protein